MGSSGVDAKGFLCAYVCHCGQNWCQNCVKTGLKTCLKKGLGEVPKLCVVSKLRHGNTCVDAAVEV